MYSYTLRGRDKLPHCLLARPDRVFFVSDARFLKILVVEDAEADYELLRLALKRAGYTVESERVEDEAEMRAALAAQAWDVVISDHRLPTFSAHGALETLQSCGMDTPFIIVSGAIGEDAAVEAMRDGADDYILKDRLARLIPAVERSMRSAAARANQRAAEAALRESEARLRAIAANLPGMLFHMRTNEDGTQPFFTYASEGSRLVFGHRAEAFLEDPQLLFNLIAAQNRPLLEAALSQAAVTMKNLRWEGRTRARSVAVRWVQIDASPRRVEGERGIVWDGLVADITPLKDAQAQLYASREELRSLSAHLERAKEQERARIAREIHDDIGGTLTGLKADMAWIKKRFGNEPGMAEKLSSMAGLVDASMQASVRIARDLRPPILDFGFVAAIEWQAKDFQKRNGVSCRLNCESEVELDSDRATAVFRIFQELLTNISKHAHANTVDIHLHADGDRLYLEVDDNGIGIGERDRAKVDSYGIRGMIERARELDGHLTVGPRDGSGTRAALELPLKNRNEGVATA